MTEEPDKKIRCKSCGQRLCDTVTKCPICGSTEIGREDTAERFLKEELKGISSPAPTVPALIVAAIPLIISMLITLFIISLIVR